MVNIIWYRYRLDHLKNMCEEELVKRVEASNAADILRSRNKYLKYLIDIGIFKNPMLSIFSGPLTNISKIYLYFLP